jgi:hypothetical protein
MEVPVDDLMKAGGAGMGGMGLIAVIARFLRGDIRRIEMQQAKINADIYSKTAENSHALGRHELKMAEDFVRKDEFTALRNHIDGQFVEQRNFFLSMLNRAIK